MHFNPLPFNSSPAKKIFNHRRNASHSALAALALLLAVPWPGAGRELDSVPATQAGLSEEKLAEVDQFMQRAVSDQKMAGAIVMISHKGKIGFFHTYGQMNLEAKKEMQPDTIFRIYSMSKAITTAAALNLCDQNKLRLNDPVSKYIASFANLKVASTNGLRDPSRAMTVRDLMLHTSGLTYGDGPTALKEAYDKIKPFSATNLEEFAERVAKVPLAFDPGSDWNYGISIDVLGRVIEVVSGQTLDVFLQKAIFDPLDMPDTSFSVPPEKIGRFAANYTRTNHSLKLFDAPAESKFAKAVTLYSGGGGLMSTARDYMRFLSMIERDGKLDGKRILRAKTVKLMTRNQLSEKTFPIHFGKECRYGTGFGLGFSVRTEIDPRWDPAGHAGEYGWGGAASTHYWASPSDRLIVITLEQIIPYQWDTEFGVKKIIYDAIRR